MTTSCRECEAIEPEYRRASFEYWANASVELREAWQVIRRLAGCTEDDLVRLEELPSKVRLWSPVPCFTLP
jgi:hypothetical protein